MASPRPRDAAATRAALLDAARALFAQEGYVHTTVRAVADRAGVNQALLFRYFGSKDGLYAEAVRADALELLAHAPPAQLLERTLNALLGSDPATAAPVLSVLRGTATPEGGDALREEMVEAYTSAFARLVDTGDPADARLRAELLLAWLFGISVLRSLPRSGAEPDAATVAAHVRRAAAALLGPVGTEARPPGPT